ncbi:MAG: peptide ABC transporter substrate-binding protein [Planctomycetes bacterium]|nr:peptide ABC transporter substrate-binding protein [Planctomycetota bacterium]
MRRDALRNLLSLGFVALLVLGSVFALSGVDRERADFVLVNGAEPESLDPAKVTGVPGGRVLRALFSGLTVQAPDSTESLPDLAESWDVSEDGRTWTFHLRDGIKWSNGEPLTADDFVYSWRRLFAPDTASKYAYLLWGVAGSEEFTTGKSNDPETVGVEAPDPRTFRVRLREPVPYFLALTAFYPTFPVHRTTVERWPDDWYRPDRFVSSGPFRLVLRSVRDRLHAVRNEHYWNAANVDLASIDILPVEDLSTALNLYLTGVCDWITDVPSYAVPELLKRDDFDPQPRIGSYFYRINQNGQDETKRRFFGNRNVRRALYFAIDRAGICERVLRGGQVPAHSIVPPGLAGYEPPMLPGRDVELARELMTKGLSELGMETAPQFSILYNTREDHKNIAEVVQSNWRDVLGLEVRLENMEWQSFLKTESSFGYDISRASWIGDYPDPNTFLDMWQSGNANNRTGYADPEYDASIREAASTTNAAKRLAILKDAEAHVLDDMVVIPIFYYVSTNCVHPWVRGLVSNFQDRHNLHFVSLDRELRKRSVR